MQKEIEVPVLVVGAGPVGLSVSLELARWGTKVMLLDRGEGVVIHPRGTGVSERTMEYFRRWGMAEDIRAGYSDDLPLNQVFCSSMTGYTYATARYPSLGDFAVPESSPVTQRRCSQDWWDRTILKALRLEENADVRYRYEFDAIEENSAQGVVSRVRDLESGDTYRVRSRFLIGCDGVDSQIRGEIGVSQDNYVLLYYAMSILFEARDLFGQLGRERGERFILVEGDRARGNVTSIDGRDLFRLLVRGGQTRFDIDTFDAEAHLRSALGTDDAEAEILSLRPWKNAQWCASSYRTDSVFLAGDAAHQMPPTGGHGANTGLTDAVNLAWKINAYLSGWGGETLLASYESERRPVALRNTAFALRNSRSWNPTVDTTRLLEDSDEGQRVRDAVGQQLMEATLPEWESLGVKLGYKYDPSPIVVPDGTDAPPDDATNYVPVARPGSRAPHAWLPDGRSTLDLFNDGFTLLDFGRDGDEELPADLTGRTDIPLRTYRIDDPEIAKLYEQRLVLVRPDGHVAWRSDAVPEGGLSQIFAIACGQGA